MPKIVNEWILVELLQLWNQFQKIPNFAQPIEVADKNWNKGLKHIHTTCKTHSKGFCFTLQHFYKYLLSKMTPFTFEIITNSEIHVFKSKNSLKWIYLYLPICT